MDGLQGGPESRSVLSEVRRRPTNGSARPSKTGYEGSQEGDHCAIAQWARTHPTRS